MELFLEGYEIKEVVGNVFYVVLIMIGFDMITGLLAGLKEKQLNSSINFAGIIKKFGEFLGLVFITFVDAYFDANGSIVKIGVGMIVIYEGISIIENFGRIGINMDFLLQYFDDRKTGRK